MGDVEDRGRKRTESQGMVPEDVGDALLDYDEQMVAEMVHFVGHYAVEPKMDHEEAGRDAEQKKAHLEVDHDVELMRDHLEVAHDVVLHVQVQALDHVLQ
jgi:hypothetical protein